MPVSSGRWLSNSVNASSPPAEAPTPTTEWGELPSVFAPAAGRTRPLHERGFRLLRRSSSRGSSSLWAGRSAHAENAQPFLADDCRSSLPHATITFLHWTNGRYC
jgi:hypothetical protein